MENYDYGEIGICSICGEKYYNWGNNAWPINNGRCCNVCNNEIVIPKRIQTMTERQMIMSKLEEYWNGVEIDRRIFTVLLRLKDNEGNLTNEYLVTRDSQEIKRFITASEESAKQIFSKMM